MSSESDSDTNFHTTLSSSSAGVFPPLVKYTSYPSIKFSVIYGPGGFPLIILLALYVVLLLIAATEAIFTWYRTKLKSNWIKKLFLTLVAIFLLIRSAQLVIPYPFGHLTYLLFSDQSPRYFLFLAWQFLALWLGSAILSSTSKSCISRNCLAAFFIFLFIIILIVSVIFSIISSV